MERLRWFFSVVVLTAAFMAVFAGCAHPPPPKPPIPVVIQLSSIENKDELVKRVDALKARDFTGSVKATLDAVDGAYLKSISDQGFEIMGIVYWNEGDTFQQQYDATLAKKSELEAAIGKPVVGFSGQGGKFNRGNENTYAVLEALKAKYIHQSSRYETMPCYVLEPYKPAGYDFVVCPMQSRCVWNTGPNELSQDTIAMSGSN